MKAVPFAFVAASLVFAGLLLLADAAPGDLDPTFDGDGIVVTAMTDNYDIGFDLAIQQDGKIIVVGDCAGRLCLARYNQNGSLDTTFDTDGKIILPLGTVRGFRAVALQPDAKIVAAGSCGFFTADDFCIARFNSNGSLDMTFDGDGVVTTPVGLTADVAEGLALQNDGKIVVAGSCGIGVSSDFCVVRYTPNGSLDLSFNGDGKVTTAILTTDTASSLLLQPDGKIVLVGYCHMTGRSDQNFCLTRYHPDGTLDQSFDGDGKVTTPVTGNVDFALASVLQRDGKIVVAGSCRPEPYASSVCVVRYLPTGVVDATFGVNGSVIVDSSAAANALALQSDGKIVTAGGCGFQICLYRFNPDGGVDVTFGSGGKVTTTTSPQTVTGADIAHGVAIQIDGKIIAAGQCLFRGHFEFCLARYLATEDPTPVATATRSPTSTPVPVDNDTALTVTPTTPVTATTTLTPLPTGAATFTPESSIAGAITAPATGDGGLQ